MAMLASCLGLFLQPDRLPTWGKLPMLVTRFSPRAAFFSLTALLIVSLVFLLPHHTTPIPVELDVDVEPGIRYEGGSLTTPPPTHDAIREYEKNLPQHDLDLPFPEGRTGRYVRFNIQPKGQGWNNILNEWYVSTRMDAAHLADHQRRHTFPGLS